MPERLSTPQMLTLAGHAIAKVDRNGPRGASYVTWAEIERHDRGSLLRLPQISPIQLRGARRGPAEGEGYD